MKSSKEFIAVGFCLALTCATQGMAQEKPACPAEAHELKICGTLSVTDYMGAPGMTPKYWIRDDDNGKLIRLGPFNQSDWWVLYMGIYKQENFCLYSDQKVITDVIDIQEFCPN